MGNLSLVDVLYAPLRFRFRLHGSRNVERLGIDLTGKETDAIPFERTRKLIWAHYEAVVAQRMPVVRRREMGIGEDRVWHYEVLTLPLSRDGETIDMLMSGLVWNK